MNYCQEIEDTIIWYEKAIGHFASRIRTMIENHGNISALEALIKSTDIQKGFKLLREKNMLDKSFEAIMVKYQKAIDFNKEAVKVAQFRLDNPRWDESM
ncbi:hypothetical protein Holit_00031 [Hollandina sp. SP2]